MKNIWIIIFIAIVIMAAIFRFISLDQRPMHCDEANQAVKSGILQETGQYRYDPKEHHGPILYYLSLPIARLTSGRDFAGTTETTFRILPALFGVGLILLLYFIVDGIGWPAVACSAVLTAISPAMVSYSRFYIQEMLLVFFTFGAIISGWKYFRTQKLSWILLLGAFLGLMYTTKETSIIAYGSMLAALSLNTILWYSRDKQVSLKKFLNYKHILIGFAVACFVTILFYTSFFTNLRGPADSILAFTAYLKRGIGHDTTHVHPWYYYIRILTYIRYGRGPVWSEALIIVMALAGSVAVFIQKKDRHVNLSLLRFIAFYTIFMAIAYSLIPYKTPWCLINFLHGMIILAGYGAVTIVRMFRHTLVKVIICLLLVAGGWHLGRQSWLSNFTYKADPRNPYVYAHTSMNFLNLVKRVEDIARIHPDGHDMFIAVITNPHDMWPLPWYLRGYNTVGYWTEVKKASLSPSPSLIITSPEKTDELDSRLNDKYQTEYYGLRPGVLQMLYIRKDLWEKFLRVILKE